MSKSKGIGKQKGYPHHTVMNQKLKTLLLGFWNFVYYSRINPDYGKAVVKGERCQCTNEA